MGSYKNAFNSTNPIKAYLIHEYPISQQVHTLFLLHHVKCQWWSQYDYWLVGGLTKCGQRKLSDFKIVILNKSKLPS